MAEGVTFTRAFAALQKAIGIAQKRHELISGNISNVDTPDYRAKDIDFKTAMAHALESEDSLRLARTSEAHMGPNGDGVNGPGPVQETGEWNGYNWVQIDREMVRLMENNMRYRTATELLLRKIAILKEVIREGGR